MSETVPFEVVPSSSVGSDTISLEAKLQNGCPKHPRWEIDNCNPQAGTKASFSAKTMEVDYLWVPTIDPKVYKLHVESCEGEAKDFEVLAYPPSKQSFEFDYQKFRSSRLKQAIDFLMEGVAVFISGNENKPEILRGRFKFEAQWREHTDHRAYYYYKISVGFDPVVGWKFKKIFGPSAIAEIAGKVPGVGKHLQKFIDGLAQAGLAITIKGGFGLDLIAERKSPDEPLFKAFGGAGITGKVEITVELISKIFDGEILEFTVGGVGGLSAVGYPFIAADGFGLQDFVFKSDGVRGLFTFRLLWGVVTLKKEAYVLEQKKIFESTQFWIYHRDEKAMT